MSENNENLRTTRKENEPWYKKRAAKAGAAGALGFLVIYSVFSVGAHLGSSKEAERIENEINPPREVNAEYVEEIEEQDSPLDHEIVYWDGVGVIEEAIVSEGGGQIEFSPYGLAEVWYEGKNVYNVYGSVQYWNQGYEYYNSYTVRLLMNDDGYMTHYEYEIHPN